MEVLAEERWNFTVFQQGDDWILTYIAGTVGMYDVSIKLTEIEVAQIRTDAALAKSLAEVFRNGREDFRAREIHPTAWPGVN